MSEGRLVTEEELEALIAKRSKDRAEFISEAVEALKPALDGVRKEIRDANHIKRTLGRQIANLTGSVKKTNAALDTHSQLSWHAGTAGVLQRLTDSVEVIGELGVDTLSQEQRKALPAVLEEHVRTREERKNLDRKERSRQNWLMVVATFASAIVGAVAAAVGMYGWLATHPAVTGGHP